VARTGLPAGMNNVVIMMEKLLRVSAVIEIATGTVLLAVPAQLISILLGGTLDAPAGTAVARIAAAAMISLGIACWLGSRDTGNQAAAGIVVGMLVYNFSIVVLFLSLRFGNGMTGIGLLPVAALHAVLGVWCISTLRKRGAG